MAKSPSELAAELATLTDGLKNAREEAKVLSAKIERLEQAQAAKIERIEQAHATTREQFVAEVSRNEEYRKRQDEWDRRRFTLIGLIVGAVLSLAVQALVTWALRK